jgi:hypothetical protein
MSDVFSTNRRVSFRSNDSISPVKGGQLGQSGGTINMNASRRVSMLNKMEMTMNGRRQSEFGIPTLLNSQSCLNIQIPVEDESPYINPEEYFRKVLDPKLLCYKCKLLYTDPIACYKCDKVYCELCLEWELNSHSRCLYCFNIVFKDIAKRVNGDINDEYEKHEVKCPYKKCREVKKLKDIREHIDDCLYRDDENDLNKLEHIEKVVCFDNDVSKLRLIYII